MDSVPHDVIILILNLVDVVELCKLSVINHKWNSIISKVEELWKWRFYEDFGGAISTCSKEENSCVFRNSYIKAQKEINEPYTESYWGLKIKYWDKTAQSVICNRPKAFKRYFQLMKKIANREIPMIVFASISLKKGYMEVLAEMEAVGCDFNTMEASELIHVALSSVDARAITWIASKGIKIVFKRFFPFETYNVDAVEYCITRGVDIRKCSFVSDSRAQISTKEIIEKFEYYASKGITLSTFNETQISRFVLNAILNLRLELLEYFFKNDAPYIRNSALPVVLSTPQSRDIVSVVRLLLQNGCTISYDFPIFNSCMWRTGALELLKLFTSFGYDLNKFRGISLLQAMNSPNYEPSTYIHVRDPARWNASLLHLVNDISILEKLLERGLHVDATDQKGMQPLHYSVSSDQIAKTKFLLERGADVNAITTECETPLYFASATMVDILCDKGANIEAKDLQGNTPLHRAVLESSKSYSKIDVIRALINRGASITVLNSDGKSLLDLAQSKTEILSFFTQLQSKESQ